MGLHSTALRMWARQADTWTSADLPQHVKSAALLAGANCPKDQALGNTGWPEENYQLCRVPRIEGLIGHDRMQKKKKYWHVWYTYPGVKVWNFFNVGVKKGLTCMKLQQTLSSSEFIQAATCNSTYWREADLIKQNPAVKLGRCPVAYLVQGHNEAGFPPGNLNSQLTDFVNLLSLPHLCPLSSPKLLF
jgi:hypothetical protein